MMEIMKQGKMPSARVLVLDGRIQSCLPVIKALRLGGHHVTIAESDPLCVGFFSRYPHERLRYRDPGTDPPGFLSDLKNYLTIGKYDVLIPILDVTSELVAKHKKELEKYVHIPVVDYPVFMLARDKSHTIKIARNHGLACPKTYFPDEMRLEEIAHLADYPVLIKPNLSMGARGITKINNFQELLRAFPIIEANYGPCSVQEYIPQTGKQYKAQIFIDRDHSIKASLICEKIRYFPPSGGSGTLFSTVKREDISQLGIRLLKAMNWHGYADLDLITDPRDGSVKIMEVNPRLTAPVKIMFKAGIDLADIIVKFALGYDVPYMNDYPMELYIRHEGLDLLWFLTSKNRLKASPSWFWFWGQNLVYQVISLDDPLPIFAYFFANVRDIFIPERRRYRYQRHIKV